jgi:biotin transporter BioY
MFKIRLIKDKIKRKKMKSHSRTSKLIIAFVIISLFSYTAAAIWLQLKIGIEISPTLTTCFYAFCTGELWLLASIKKSKIANGQKSRAYDAEIDNYKGESNIDNESEPKG